MEINETRKPTPKTYFKDRRELRGTLTDINYITPAVMWRLRTKPVMKHCQESEIRSIMQKKDKHYQKILGRINLARNR